MYYQVPYSTTKDNHITLLVFGKSYSITPDHNRIVEITELLSRRELPCGIHFRCAILNEVECSRLSKYITK